MNNAFNLVSFWGMEYYTGSASLLVRRPICVDTTLRVFFCLMAFHIVEFHNEVNNYLFLYGST